MFPSSLPLVIPELPQRLVIGWLSNWSVIVMIDWQLDRVWNPQGQRRLGISVRVYRLGQLRYKTHHDPWHQSMNCGPGLNEKDKVGWPSSVIALCFPNADVTWPAASCFCHLASPTMMSCILTVWGQVHTSFLKL